MVFVRETESVDDEDPECERGDEGEWEAVEELEERHKVGGGERKTHCEKRKKGRT